MNTRILQKKYHFVKPSQCKPSLRCNNYKECPKCQEIWRKKHFSQSTNFTENELKAFKYKYYIVFKSHKMFRFDEQNSNLDLFLSAFLRKKRNKNFIINGEIEYFITKEISLTKKYGYHPHYNVIILSKKRLNFQNFSFISLINKHSISFWQEEIKKHQEKFKTSLERLINYFLKLDTDSQQLERITKITKNKRNLLKSKFFSKKRLIKKVPLARGFVVFLDRNLLILISWNDLSQFEYFNSIVSIPP